MIITQLIGILALVTHFEESDAVSTGSIGDAQQNRTVTTTVVSNIRGPFQSISITITNDSGTGAKTQREIAIGDEITQLFFGEAPAAADSKGSASEPRVTTQAETVGDNVPVIPVQQEDTTIGTTIDSMANPIDSIPITAEDGIQQTGVNVDEQITQVQPETGNFEGAVNTGDSFIVGEIEKVLPPPTETTGSQIIQVEQEPVIEKVDPSATADIFTTTFTTGDGIQTNVADAQGSAIPSIVDVTGFQTTIPPIFVSSEVTGKLSMEPQEEVLDVQVNPDKYSFNIPWAAKQIPIFINSKIKHAVFNIHVPTSPSTHSQFSGIEVENKPKESSLEIEISGHQLPAAIESATQMPNLPQVAQVEDINLGKSDPVTVMDGEVTGTSQIHQEASIADAAFFEIDKIIIGTGVNQTDTTPADTFAIDGIVAQTDTYGDQVLFQVQQPPNIPNFISDERAMRSALASLATRVNSAQLVAGGRVNNGRALSQHFDEDNISLEVIGFISKNNQRGIINQTVDGNQQRPLLIKFDDDGSLSTEVMGHMNENQTISLSGPSQDATLVLSPEGDRQNGNVQTMTVSQVQTSVNAGVLNGEIDVDISVEKAADGPTLAPDNIFGNSDEQDDDLSLEVNFNLLPKIKRLLWPQLRKKEKRPEMVFFRHSGEEKDDDDTLKMNDILADRVFQQKLQEMDGRLKTVTVERGKRLMEKYAEALAMSSVAAATINFSFYLPLLVACLLVNWFS